MLLILVMIFVVQFIFEAHPLDLKAHAKKSCLAKIHGRKFRSCTAAGVPISLSASQALDLDIRAMPGEGETVNQVTHPCVGQLH